MKPVVMVMAVVEVNNHQSVQVQIGLGDGQTFTYLGSLNCDFKQFGILHSILKKVPEVFLDYKAKKWTQYIAKIMQELASL